MLKKIRNITALIAAVYIVYAFAVLLAPGQVEAVTGFIIGAAALIFGIYKIIIYFKKTKIESVLATDLFIGSTFCFIAVASVINHARFSTYFSVVFGIMLLLGAMIKVQNAIDLKAMSYEFWWVVLILGLLSVAMSMFMFVGPDFAVKVYTLLGGIFLIIDGGASFAAVVMFQMRFTLIKQAIKTGIPIEELRPKREPKEPRPPKPLEGEKKPFFGFLKKKHNEQNADDPFNGEGEGIPPMPNVGDPMPPMPDGMTPPPVNEGPDMVPPMPDAGEVRPETDEPMDAVFESAADSNPAPWEQPVESPEPKFDPETGEKLVP